MTSDALRTYPLGPHYAHLDALAEIRPIEVTPEFWQGGVNALPPGRLISTFETAADWDTWERHPIGEEFILQLEGAMRLHVEGADGDVSTADLPAGHFIVVPTGLWHTADVIEPGRALYITAGEGTEVRSRA